jgi:hypothetical protein
MVSPYFGIPVEKWADKTKELIEQHPLDVNEIYEIVISVWEEIFESSITSRGYKIGKDIFPSPQIIGYLLHELIPLELSSRYPQLWRREENAKEKDLVYIPDPSFSVELKHLLILGRLQVIEVLLKKVKQEKPRKINQDTI